MARFDLLQCLALSLLLCRGQALLSVPWVPVPRTDPPFFGSGSPRTTTFVRREAIRYGPVQVDRLDEDDASKTQARDDARLQKDLHDFLEKVVSVKDPNHLPSVLSRNMDVVLRVSSRPDGIKAVEAAMRAIQERYGDDAADLANQALDTVLTGAEAFVENAHKLDLQNKQLLGKIVRLLADKSLSDRGREEALDALLEREVDSFTPGFLRHVEAECDRIAGAPTMSPESSRLLQILRLVQSRVVEEIGKDMGEAALVLGQLIGYETKSERLAVLDAGLAVRGMEYAEEMLSLAEEALDGFSRIPGGADPDLVVCVCEIRDRLRHHVESDRDFQ